MDQADHPRGRAETRDLSRWPGVAAVLFFSLVAACGSDSGSSSELGLECESDDECGSGPCVRLDGERFCSSLCESDCDCPMGYACSSTSGSQSVCAPGTSECTRDAGTALDASTGGCGDGCPEGQVCSAGSCEEIPSSCPCPPGSYCDLATDTCEPGCRSDDHCAMGEICEDDECRVGCRGDDDCGSSEICKSLTCTEGCRKDEDCSSGEVCDDTTCRMGCNSDTECDGSNQVCDESERVCRTGCRNHDDCGDGEICDESAAMCVEGCLDDSECTAEETICEGRRCVDGCRVGTDCESGVCAGQECQEPRCGDRVVNQDSEDCDGSAPEGSCRDLHESYLGTASCTSRCTLTNTGCCIRYGYGCATGSSALPCCSGSCVSGTCS